MEARFSHPNPILSRRCQLVTALVAVLAALVVAGGARSAEPAGGGSGSAEIVQSRTLPSSCARSQSFAAACRIVIGYFQAMNTGNFEGACSLLGLRLRLETGGVDCPRLLAASGPQRYDLLGVRRVVGGVGVLVSLGFGELGHVRQLTWMAFVGTEANRLRIIVTRRWEPEAALEEGR
jgi:hypothetical protein